MTLSVALILVIGVPLTLLSLGFFLLCLKLHRAQGNDLKIETLISVTKSLEEDLNELENRLAALEVITIGVETRGRAYHQ
ncbi:MAG: hypothetical protein LBS60_10085 [Deltaproteobacteria bacterium]|jgi:hypothetical protein|nr:hypothetical protein [Deltaproteobacteria bacterium]